MCGLAFSSSGSRCCRWCSSHVVGRPGPCVLPRVVGGCAQPVVWRSPTLHHSHHTRAWLDVLHPSPALPQKPPTPHAKDRRPHNASTPLGLWPSCPCGSPTCTLPQHRAPSFHHQGQQEEARLISRFGVDLLRGAPASAQDHATHASTPSSPSHAAAAARPRTTAAAGLARPARGGRRGRRGGVLDQQPHGGRLHHARQ